MNLNVTWWKLHSQAAVKVLYGALIQADLLCHQFLYVISDLKFFIFMLTSGIFIYQFLLLLCGVHWTLVPFWIRVTAASVTLKSQTSLRMFTTSAPTPPKSLREEWATCPRGVWMSTSVKLRGKMMLGWMTMGYSEVIGWCSSKIRH